jgi:hypothetical protein
MVSEASKDSDTTQGGVSRQHEEESQQTGDKLALRFLGLFETTPYTLEQSHGIPPGSVVLDNTTLGGSGSCGYPSLKTIRSIVDQEFRKNNPIAFEVLMVLAVANLFGFYNPKQLADFLEVPHQKFYAELQN